MIADEAEAVVIGTSAGALEALSVILPALPDAVQAASDGGGSRAAGQAKRVGGTIPGKVPAASSRGRR